MNPSLVAVKSTVGAPYALAPHVQRKDYVLEKNGGLEPLSSINPVKKMLIGKKDLITVLPGQQTLVFKNNYIFGNYHIHATLEAVVAPDIKQPHTFINAFFKGGGTRRDYISSGLLVSALKAEVDKRIRQNLMILPMDTWARYKNGEPVKSATRYSELATFCKTLGLKLFYDKLVLNVSVQRS